MALRRRISENVQRQVRNRAGGLCEYCHTDEKWQYVLFTIDHIVALAQGGSDGFENLALVHCTGKFATLKDVM